ncbi:hypothetical protein [Gillisia sp. JM1]|uniref:hypothetical protein n=1 Tax=Gillisia sp. JM1 TaxID=1283286 RepID=UPI000429048C|nr:hypothetical protein [Gillisia sp. JM1]
MEKIGVDIIVLDSVCCGLAGSFGFEKDHHQVAMKEGERVLLPAVRKEDKDTIILTNGFNVHLAELMLTAITGDDLNKQNPEEHYRHNYVEETTESNLIASILIAARSVLVIGLAALWIRKDK